MSLTILESSAIQACRSGDNFSDREFDPDNKSDWLEIGLHIMLRAGAIVRKMRLLPLNETVKFKEDGSPATKEEHDIERYTSDLLTRIIPGIRFLGEESGGSIPHRG